MNQMRRIDGEEPSETMVLAPPAPARPWWRLPLMLLVPLLVVAAGLWMWATGGRTVSTDNAQVNAHVVSVAPEVSGRIIEVDVVENQHVNRGDVLYRIDPAPYRIALEQADAAVGAARVQVAQLQGGYSSKVADIGSKASDVALAQQNFDRQKILLGQGFTTRANYDAARAALDAAQAQRSVAQADAGAARALLQNGGTGGHPQIEAALAARDKAALDLSRTVVRAPMAGTISQSDKLNVGAIAVQMLSNVSVVGSDYWIEANFKETQLGRIGVGQRATVKLDAIGGRTLAAHVIGVGSGTGAQFSLLPAQNATGNWVKVTQRVPVRIKLDEAPGRALVAGWSAHVTVHLR